MNLILIKHYEKNVEPFVRAFINITVKRTVKRTVRVAVSLGRVRVSGGYGGQKWTLWGTNVDSKGDKCIATSFNRWYTFFSRKGDIC